MGFTKEFCEKLKKLYLAGFTCGELAYMYKIEENTIKAIVKH